MKRLDKDNSVRPTPESRAYLDVLKKKGVFRRSIDAYTFAAAYAILNEIDPKEIPSRGRQDLVNLNQRIAKNY